MMQPYDSQSLEAYAQMMAQPDPRDMPRRAHVYHCEGDPNRRLTRLPGIHMAWMQHRHLEIDAEEPLAPAAHAWKRRARRPINLHLRVRAASDRHRIGAQLLRDGALTLLRETRQQPQPIDGRTGMHNMRRLMIAATTMAALTFTTLRAADNETAKRLSDAAIVFAEVMDAPDKSLPQDLLEKAHCIVIVPDLKTAAFGVGGKYGKGYLSCRNAAGTGWSAPGTIRIEGGSVGFQIGASSTDLVMLVMNARGADKLLGSKFTLGVEGSVAAGPVGRTATAQTDAQMSADILSWSRTQGLFAGVALEGATLRQDLDDNADLYGKKIENRQIVTKGVPVPKAALRLIALLNKHSAKERRTN